MNAYSEENAIYFQISSITGFARYNTKQISAGVYYGEPPYKMQKLPFSQLLKECHAAEHQVFNSFMNKIRQLKANTRLEEFYKYLPSLYESKSSSSFSIFCGSTIYLGSGILLILAAIPNIFHWHNTDLIFMLSWLAGSLFLSYLIIRIIQYKFFLAPTRDYQLELALTALKEVLYHAKHC